MSKTALIIPCYNEERRLSGDCVLALVADDRLRVVLVDDGSTDRTVERLEEIRRGAADRIDVLRLSPNRGKAEAVRAGLLQALEGGAAAVGYADADFSTPPGELLWMVDELERQGASAVIGARWARLGSHIERHATRHYMGRVFATFASLTLGRAVYDTQCGAKLFRDSEALREALAEPFRSRWAFDVELLGRLFRAEEAGRPTGGSGVVELPLREWRDVAGSKLRLGAMIRAGLDLAAIARDLRRR